MWNIQIINNQLFKSLVPLVPLNFIYLVDTSKSKREKRGVGKIENAVNMVIQKILEAVSETTGVSKSKIQGPERYKKTMAARHLFCYFAKEKTNATLLQIGNMINRHHSTVINSLSLISDMIDIGDEETKNNIQKIDDYIRDKYQQDIILKIVLPFDVDLKKVDIFLKNELKAKCVEKL